MNLKGILATIALILVTLVTATTEASASESCHEQPIEVETWASYMLVIEGLTDAQPSLRLLNADVSNLVIDAASAMACEVQATIEAAERFGWTSRARAHKAHNRSLANALEQIGEEITNSRLPVHMTDDAWNVLTTSYETIRAAQLAQRREHIRLEAEGYDDDSVRAAAEAAHVANVGERYLRIFRNRMLEAREIAPPPQPPTPQQTEALASAEEIEETPTEREPTSVAAPTIRVKTRVVVLQPTMAKMRAQLASAGIFTAKDWEIYSMCAVAIILLFVVALLSFLIGRRRDAEPDVTTVEESRVTQYNTAADPKSSTVSINVAGLLMDENEAAEPVRWETGRGRGEDRPADTNTRLIDPEETAPTFQLTPLGADHVIGTPSPNFTESGQTERRVVIDLDPVTPSRRVTPPPIPEATRSKPPAYGEPGWRAWFNTTRAKVERFNAQY